MRSLFLLCLALAACSADPVLLPDAGPCSAACGAGTVCSGGACVAVDAGGADVPAVDVAEDRGVDAGADVVVVDAPAGDVVDAAAADAGVDVVAVDVRSDVPVRCDGGSPDAAAYLCGGVCCSVVCCGGVCADTQSNPSHCGGCEVSCGAAPHAVLSCRSGSCAVSACSAPFADCNGGFGDGCETNTLTDPRHCGNCATSCDPYPHTSGSCALGRCEYECVPGFADCDGLQITGCEREVGDGGRCP